MMLNFMHLYDTFFIHLIIMSPVTIRMAPQSQQMFMCGRMNSSKKASRGKIDYHFVLIESRMIVNKSTFHNSLHITDLWK
jgi:hypothetical protein